MDKGKLSTFIRLGSKLRPQGFGALETIKGNTCAIGAAFHAKMGMSPLEFHPSDTSTFYCELTKIFPELETHIYHNKTVLSSIITKLNDIDKLTREEIADWLEERGY